MESSALFAVAKLRKVKIASMFVVSDVLANEKWDPQFHKFDFIKTLNQLVDVAINCLEKK
jgi:purine-nucleoside phosphorylase